MTTDQPLTGGAATAEEPLVRHRATALPPDERRAAIVRATVPLLVAHGTAVTTRQIAAAAGVAEGTIFRVFPDKDAVIEAALDAAMDPAPIEQALAGIDPTLPLEGRLVAATEVLQARFTEIWRLMAALGRAPTPDARPKARERARAGRVLAELLGPDADRLRRDPEEVAQLLRGLILACSHPLLVDTPLPASEIVSILLDGVRRA